MTEKRIRNSFDTERTSHLAGFSVSSAIMVLAAGVTRPDRIEAALDTISRATGILDRVWLYKLDYDQTDTPEKIVTEWSKQNG